MNKIGEYFTYDEENKAITINKMARPIKDTPTLEGKDIDNFLKEIESAKPISNEEKKEMLADYNYLERIYRGNI